MPRVSKARLHNERLQEIGEHFSYLISSLKTSGEIENFFTEFLTKEEKIMLAKRLVLFMMLKRDYSPSMIQSALHISYETVRNYQNQLHHKNAVFQRIIEKLVKREKTEEFFQKLEKILKPVELFLRSKTDMKARAKFASGDWS